jgi:hypothetical protein
MNHGRLRNEANSESLDCVEKNNLGGPTKVPIDVRFSYLVIAWQKYQTATSRKAKTELLDTVVSFSGLRRDSVSRILRSDRAPQRVPRKVEKRVLYGVEVVQQLTILWKRLNRAGGRKIKAAMHDWVPGLDCSLAVKQKLYQIGKSQIDLLLKPIRAEWRRKHHTGTKRAKPKFITQVPIKELGKTQMEQGHVEVDTVAHCGESLSGNFIWTLTLVDVFSRWTECSPVWSKDSKQVSSTLGRLESILPFEIKSLSSDCGTEFMNENVIEGFAKDPRRSAPIQQVRGRPYKKNDNCYVEQKNNTHVRNLLGYGRLGASCLLERVESLYRDWCDLQNFFVPQIHLKQKIREGSQIRRTFSEPKTPYEIVITDPRTPSERKLELIKKKSTMCPHEMTRRVRVKLRYIFQYLEISRNLRGRVAA